MCITFRVDKVVTKKELCKLLYGGQFIKYIVQFQFRQSYKKYRYRQLAVRRQNAQSPEEGRVC